MKSTLVRAGVATLAVTFCLGPIARLAAQTAPASPTASANENDEPVLLSPFLVESEGTADGYQARETLAGTRIRTELKDVGSAIQVVTEQFLKDTGARKNEDLLVYTTNTEVGGTGGNFTGNGTGTSYVNTDSQRVAPHETTRVRGLTSADNTRDFFVTNIPWDSYNVSRIDLQRGPNSILFGLGSPAGIINSTLKSAAFRTTGNVEARFGSYGSYRGSLDYNHALLPDELAIRASLLHDHTKYRQDPAFNEDKRRYAALRYDPSFLRTDSARTSFRINYEYGDIDANRPRVTPPVDAITPWFDTGPGGLNRRTFDAATINTQPTAEQNAADLSIGAISRTRADGSSNLMSNGGSFQPWIDGPAGRIYDGVVTIFDHPSDSTGSVYFTGEIQPKPSGTPWYPIRGIQPYHEYAKKAGLPGSQFGIYNPRSLRDPSIFDFYNKLIDGPNKREWQKFEAFNAALSQTFFNDRAGIELVYDRQRYSQGQTNLLAADNGQILTIDVMRTLPDGSPNPNVGRPMLSSDSSGNNNRTWTDRDSWRATAFAEIDFRDRLDDARLGRILGRHVFTGLFSGSENMQEGRTWVRYATDNNYAPASGNPINQATRAVNVLAYLGPSLANATSAAGAGIGHLQATMLPVNGQVRLGNSDLGTAVTQNLGIWNADLGQIDQLYTNSSSKLRDEVESQALVWQGYFFDGTVVPMIGWRHDRAKNFNAGSPPVNSIQQAQVNSPNWRLPTGPDDATGGRTYNSNRGDSLTKSIVVHTPASLRERLGGVRLSAFYNESENFRPDASRRDLFGSVVAPATGETKDYGIMISALNDRVTFKVNWYETQVRNVTLSNDLLPNFYLIGAGEAWGYAFARWAQLGPDANAYGEAGASAFGPNFNRTNPDDNTSPLIDPTLNPAQGGWLAYQPGPGQTVAQAFAEQQAAIQALISNPPPAAFLRNWGIDLSVPTADWGNMTPWAQPGGVVVTGDTYSKGIEFEFTAQPLPNWNITINAAKTRSERSNLAKSYSDWIEERYALYQGPAGNVRLWGGWYGGETVRSKFEAETYGNYALFTKLANGSEAPEIRPWRFNVVTNYSFENGLLRGFDIGGGYRWQDKVVVGYPFNTTTNTWDITRPYKGPSLTNVDFWVGYERRLGRKYLWHIQLNVKNAFADDDLIPVTVNPDGSMASARIPEETVWSITNSIAF